MKPRIDRDSFNESIMLKQGQEFTIEVKFFGEPPPKAVWTQGTKVRVRYFVMALFLFDPRSEPCFKFVLIFVDFDLADVSRG